MDSPAAPQRSIAHGIMFHFNINLTSLALILWAGMMVIAGSIWVLSSQVRKVADLLDDHGRRSQAEASRGAPVTSTRSPRVPRASVRRTVNAPGRRVTRALGPVGAQASR